VLRRPPTTRRSRSRRGPSSPSPPTSDSSPRRPSASRHGCRCGRSPRDRLDRRGVRRATCSRRSPR
jgi:hypothetical protein